MEIRCFGAHLPSPTRCRLPALVAPAALEPREDPGTKVTPAPPGRADSCLAMAGTPQTSTSPPAVTATRRFQHHAAGDSGHPGTDSAGRERPRSPRQPRLAKMTFLPINHPLQLAEPPHAIKRVPGGCAQPSARAQDATGHRGDRPSASPLRGTGDPSGGCSMAAQGRIKPLSLFFTPRSSSPSSREAPFVQRKQQY